MAVARTLGGGPDQREHDLPPLLGHPHRQGLGPTTQLDALDRKLDPVELGRSEEVAVEADRPLNPGDRPGRPQRQRGKVAATWPPDLPGIAQHGRVGAVRSLELRRRVE